MKKIYHTVMDLYTNHREALTYIFFGGLTTVVSLVVYHICLLIFLPGDASEGTAAAVVLANTISTVIAVLFAFITNKIWVFESRDFSFTITVQELAKFSLGRLFTFFVDTALLLFLVGISLHPVLSKYITQVIVIILNYIISKKAVFKT